MAHAIDDIELKKNQKQKNLLIELKANNTILNNNKQLIALDEIKKKKELEMNKKYQEDLFLESLELVKQKKNEKKKLCNEDNKVFQEKELQHEQQTIQKNQDLKNKIGRSTDGAVHNIVQNIIKTKKMKEDEYFEKNLKTENTLNKQLFESENAAIQRKLHNGKNLASEWSKNRKNLEKKRQDDEQLNNQIFLQMKRLLAEQEEKEIQKKPNNTQNM